MANTQTTTSGYPEWITGPTQGALTDIQKWLKSTNNYVYGSKPGEALTTPLDPYQRKAISKAGWLGNLNPSQLGGLFGLNDATKMLMGATGSITDEKGAFGSIQGDMNPYIQQVLDPQLRQLNEQRQMSENDLSASQQSAGAFGDARHGVYEAQLNRDATQAATDVTGRAYAQAYDDAMARRQSDRDAMFTGASGLAGLGKQRFDMYSDTNDALFNAGEVSRDAAEEKRAAMEKFKTAIKDKKYNDALKLLSAITGTAQPTTTTTETKSNDGIWGILGSLFGAAM